MISFIKKYFYHPIKNLIAKYYVFVLQEWFGLVVIGITGSAGKTTTKEMLAGVLKMKGNTVWSFANIDPIFNISSTILRCTPKTKYLVLEMGVEHPGEMDFYLSLVKPKIGLITNIFPAHTLYFGDIDGVFKEKAKLASNTNLVVLNKDDSKLSELEGRIKTNIVWFRADLNPLVQNQNAVRKICQVLGISDSLIQKGLKSYNPPEHRLQIIKHKSGAVILDDSYNSNPQAFIASLKYFINLARGSRKIAVVGDMLELGDNEVALHKRIGKELNNFKFEKVFGVGKLVKEITKDVYDNSLQVLPHLKPYLKKGNYIFIKGSHSIGLDKLVSRL